MKIFVKTNPSARQVKVEQLDETHFKVWVKEPPAKGLANKGLVKALADHFNISATDIQITSGFTSRNKVVRIEK